MPGKIKVTASSDTLRNILSYKETIKARDGPTPIVSEF
jgi:hypothetical protein